MTPQPTLALTETGNLQIHIPMRIRRMRGRKMIFAPEALDGDVPDSPSDVQAALVQALGRAFSWSDAILRVGSFTPSRIWRGTWTWTIPTWCAS